MRRVWQNWRMRVGKSSSALLLGCAAALLGCNERREPPRAFVPVASASVPRPLDATRAPRTATKEPEPLTVSGLPDDESPPPSVSDAESKPVSKLIIDLAQMIGPAGQMTATERGVWMLDRNDELQLSKRAAPSSNPRPESARFSRISGGPNDFFAVARGPFLLRGKAYWVRDGKLVRRAQDNSGPLETLASDARNGTRVAGADVPGAPAHAVYISNPVGEEAPRAKLWVEGAPPETVSPEGAGASSIAVVADGEYAYIVSIDARSAMTPMHGRRLRFKDGKPELEPDVVMWVGATSQTLSEVFASLTPFGVRAFLPIERDISHFGLVMLDLGHAPHMDPATVYRGYPNGIDVAPVGSAAFCGSAFVAYARPESATPDAAQVLEVAEITSAGLGPAELVASARGFSNISLAGATNSAVLAYVADFRTFATTLRCTHKK